MLFCQVRVDPARTIVEGLIEKEHLRPSPNLLSNIRRFKQINFYIPQNYQKIIGFLTISGGIEINSLKFACN